MAIKLMINGIEGRMGRATQQYLSTHPRFELTVGQGRDDDLAQAIKLHQPDVVVDFTHADHAFTHCKTIIEHQARPVIGTSGLTEFEVHTLQQLAKPFKLGGVIAPNFSIGAVLMMQFAKTAAPYFKTAEIIEAHHDKKLDSPSGTAIKTAEMLKPGTAAKSKLNEVEVLPNARGAVHQDIHIHSLRMPGILAQQQIWLGGEAETLVIQHNTLDRACFMPGVVLACEKAMQLDKIVYGLEECLQ